MNYDQWKTASPYDDLPDWQDEAEKWLKNNESYRNIDPDSVSMYSEAAAIDAVYIIEGLLEYIKENV